MDVSLHGTISSAYTPIPIFSGLPLHIECITGYDEFVLVGTKEGHLLIYKITFKPGVSSPDIEIAHSNKHFSKKSILQLGVIPEHKILVSLTSDGVSVSDMSSYNCPNLTTIEKTKGASLFALDIKRFTSSTGDPSIIVRLCVILGRKIQLYYWKNRTFNELREELSVPDTPKCVTWCGETLCFGLRSEYCTMDLLSGTSKTVCATTKSGEPIMARVSKNAFAVVQDKQSFIIHLESETKKSRTEMVLEVKDESTTEEMNLAVSWSETPIGLQYDDPYFIGVLPGKGVEVKTVKPKLKIDVFNLPGVKLVCKTKTGHVFVASLNCVWCLKSSPVDLQMDTFVKQKHFELALSLAHIWEEELEIKAAKIGKIKNLHAFHLFCNKKFREAMQMFIERKTDASHVIGLFPNLLPEEFRNQMEYPGPLPELRGSDLENGLTELIRFLTSTRNVLLGSPNSPVDSTPIFEGGNTIKSRKQLLQIIDTTLLKCYLQTNESLVASLLRLKENYCHLEETERALITYGKLNELIILYQTKGLHRKALESLQKHHNIDRIVTYLQHLGREEIDLILEFSKVVFQKDSSKGLKIFTEDIQEVEQLSRPKIYDFLSKNFKSAVIAYLEHVINIWADKNPLFHNALVHQYRERAAHENNPETKKDYREKLMSFLQSSAHYTPEIVLVHFPYNDLFEERALILEKLRRHEQVLIIYTGVLCDVDKAMSYCKRMYDKNDPSTKDVFTMLIKMLMNPSSNPIPGVTFEGKEENCKPEPDLSSVMKLLKECAPYLDPIKVLSCLPDDLEIKEINGFLQTSIQSHLSERRQLLIQKGLVNAEYLRSKIQKIQTESERFSLNNTPCYVCGKRLGSQSAFARYPEGSIVHFSCQPSEMSAK